MDDVSREILGNLIEKIMEKGAKDVSIYHGITKKGRPTNLVSVICSDENVSPSGSIESNQLVRVTGYGSPQFFQELSLVPMN